MKQYRYKELAESFISSINEGVFQTGDKLPGIRSVCRQEDVSAATAVAAYSLLEEGGYVEARPRSGFYVSARTESHLIEPDVSDPVLQPNLVRGQDLVLRLIQSLRHPDVVQLGAAIPADEYLPLRQVQQLISELTLQSGKSITSAPVDDLEGNLLSGNNSSQRSYLSQYTLPGLPVLRQQLAKHMRNAGCEIKADDVVVTAGCQEAIYLTLKTLTIPGDIIAVESPTFYGFLQAIESLGLKVLEIPTHPKTGISLDALQLAVEQWPIKVCLVMPTFGNPIGSCMPEENKIKLVGLANEHDFHIIEDDIYGDFSFDQRRPKSLKAFDDSERVIYCSSFSKSISPGLRLGWVVSAQFKKELIYQKFIISCSTSSLSQVVIAKFLSGGHYKKHMRSMRMSTESSVKKMIGAVESYFPVDTKITKPNGGFVLWVELPKSINTLELANQAIAHNISIAPGKLFSSTKKYDHCLRLSCAVVWTKKVDSSLKIIGRLLSQSLQSD
ncbi:MAG: PLP-dependent aminotransferase family protein [Cellvibrionaceae bacterium]